MSLVEPLEGRRLFSALASVVATKAAAPLSAAVVAAAATTDVQFSAPRGFYTAPFGLTLSTATPNATIRYTLDGSAPTATTGSVYAGPMNITTTTVVRAVAVTNGLDPSVVQTNTYLYLNDVLKQKKTVAGYPNPTLADGNYPSQTLDYEMDPKVTGDPAYSGKMITALKSIPSMMISVPKDKIFGAAGFYQTKDVEVPISIEYYDPAHPGDSVQQNAGVEGHADATPKRSLRVKFKKIYGKGKLESRLLQHVPVGGQTATDEIDSLVLRAGNNRAWATGTGSSIKTTFTEDEFGRQQQIAMTGQGVHGQFVHLYINGIYFGLYNAAERPDEGYGEAYYGADEENWFAINHDNDTKNGDRTRWDTMVKTVAPKDMANAANYAEMKTYLDVDQFADYIVGQSYAGVTDWPNNNWWAGGDTSKKMPFKFFVWDAEHQFNGQSGDITEIPYGAWLHPKLRPGDTSSPTVAPILLWRSLVKSPEFRLLLADKIVKAIGPGGALSDAESLKRFDALNNYVRDAVIGESARWGDAVAGRGLRTRDGNWAPAVKAIRDLIPGNGEQLIAAFRKYGYFPSINAVKASLPTGLVDAGTKLTLTNPNANGTIYYTLDGTDPRLPGGGLSPKALVYGGAAGITLNASSSLIARVKSSSGEWSAATTATYTLKAADPRNLRVTEMMYHPADADPALDSDEYEFLEFQNTGKSPLKLNGIVVSGGIDLTFGDVTLAPGQYGVIARNPDALAGLHGPAVNVLGTYTGKLDNKGERILVTAPGNVTIADYTYADAWYPDTDGPGYAMVVANPTGDVAALNTAAGWKTGGTLNGTPGRGESAVIVNVKPEVNAGVDRDVTLPNALTLTGTVTDTTIPDGGSLTSLWTLVSGPGTVTFGTATKPSTTATFSVAGTYVLRLSAADGELAFSDDVTVVVKPAVTPPTNTKPNVSAGPDRDVTLPAGLTLEGSATDDGLPTPAKLTVAWSLVSGPGTATFASPAAVKSAVTFSVAGTYVLRLIASDGALSASDDVTVTVKPVVTPPTNGKLSGYVFADLNANGKFDGSDYRENDVVVFLDANNDGKRTTGEAFTYSVGGAWSFDNVSAGTYRVRRELASGYTYSTPLIDVTLAAGQHVADLSIGSKKGTTSPPTTGTGSISGVVFWDANKNGKQDSGEAGQAGKVVFLDTDNDGVLDSGETSVTTDSKGNFTFKTLAAGKYTVRRVVPKGYKVTTSVPSVTLTTGQTVTGVKIGTANA